MALVISKREPPKLTGPRTPDGPTDPDMAGEPTESRRPGGATKSRERAPAPRKAHPLDVLTSAALAQLDGAIALLRGDDRELAAQRVHETRKALKRLRALMRMLRVWLGPKRFARENATLRDAALALAGARDAEVMVATLEQLLANHPKRFSRSAAIARLHARLAHERQARIAAGGNDGQDTREEVVRALLEVRARVVEWKFGAGDEQAVRHGLHRLYRDGRRRGRDATRKPTVQLLHDWRKRVKDLRYATQMLGGSELGSSGRPGRELKALSGRADRLGELLGEEHDLALLAARVRAERACFDGERATGKDLLRRIERRRGRLRREALRRGKRLYRSPPRKLPIPALLE